MSKDLPVFTWKEPVEIIEFDKAGLRTGPGRHVVRVAAVFLLISVLLYLATREVWMFAMAGASILIIWGLRGGLILHRLGMDIRQRVEVGSQKIRISHAMGIAWVPLRTFKFYSLSNWSVGAYQGHELMLKSRRGACEIRVGIPAGFDVVALRQHFTGLGLTEVVPKSLGVAR